MLGGSDTRRRRIRTPFQNSFFFDMKVLFVHAALSGFSAEYTVHATLAANAKARGVESSFIWQGPVDLPVLANAGLDSVTVHDFGRDLSITPKPSKQRRAQLMASRLPASIAALTRTVERVRPDVIYTSQQLLDLYLARLCHRRFGIPHVVHLHYSVGPWIGRTAVRMIRHTPRVIAVSEYVRQTALLQGAKPESVTTIVNPLPFTHADVDFVDRARVRASLGISPDAPLIVAAGRLDPGKGHTQLLEAYKLVLDRLPQARLLICGTAGSEEYGNSIRRHARDLGVDGSTVFAGWRGDMPQIYRAADVFCLPSELEPCALVYLEAMAAALPVVAVYSGGTPELVMHERTGLLSYPNDIVALAGHLTELLCDQALARDLGTAGQKRVHGELNGCTVAQRWTNVLTDIE